MLLRRQARWSVDFLYHVSLFCWLTHVGFAGGNAPRTLPDGLKSLPDDASVAATTPSPPTNQRDPSPARPLLGPHLSASSVSSAVSSASEPAHSGDVTVAGRKHSHMGHHKDVQAAHKPHALAHGAHASGHHTPAGFSPYPHLLPHNAHAHAHAHGGLGSVRAEVSRSVDDLSSYFPGSEPAAGLPGTASAPHPLQGLGWGSKYTLPPLLTRSPSSASLSSNASQQQPQPSSAGPLSAPHATRPHPHSHLSDVSYPWPQGSPAVPAPSTPSLPAPPETPAMSEEQFLRAFQAALATGGAGVQPVQQAGSSTGTPDLRGSGDGAPIEAGVDEFTFGTAQGPSFWPERTGMEPAGGTTSSYSPMYQANYAEPIPSSIPPAESDAYVPSPNPARFDFASWARSTSGYAASVSTTGTDHPAQSDYSAIPPTSSTWDPNPLQQQQSFSSAYDGQLGRLSLGTGGGTDFDELLVERWRTHAAHLDAQGGGAEHEHGGFGAPLQQVSSISSAASWTSAGASAMPSSAAAMNQLNLASQAQVGVKQEEVWDDGPGLSPTFEKEFELDPQWALNHPSHPHHQLSPDQWLPLDDDAPLGQARQQPAEAGPRAVSAQALYPDAGPSMPFGTMRQDASFDAFFSASSAAGSEASFSLARPQSRSQSVLSFASGAGGHGRGGGDVPIPYELGGFPELGLEEGKADLGAGATPRYEEGGGAGEGEEERRRREGTVMAAGVGAGVGWGLLDEEVDIKPDVGRS